jgi:hypothetical protein
MQTITTIGLDIAKSVFQGAKVRTGGRALPCSPQPANQGLPKAPGDLDTQTDAHPARFKHRRYFP